MNLNKTYLCTLMLKYLVEVGNGDRTETEVIVNLTNDDFERAFIPLASHWDNDVFDLCIETLGIQTPAEFKTINLDNFDVWQDWIEKTVNERWNGMKPARVWNDAKKTWDDPV